MRDVDAGESRAAQDGGHHAGQIALVVHDEDALVAQMLVHHAEPSQRHSQPPSLALYRIMPHLRIGSRRVRADVRRAQGGIGGDAAHGGQKGCAAAPSFGEK